MKTKNQPTLLRLLMAALMMIVCLSAGADTKPDGEEITFSQTVNGANLNFKLHTGYNSGITTAKVTGFAEGANFNGILHIPATVTYNGTTYNISTVNGFYNCNNITGVILDRISTIERYAFDHCRNLAFVQVYSFFLADDMWASDYKGFTKYAFDNCTALTDIIIPQKADKQYNEYPYKQIETYNIDPEAFVGCSSLSNITVTNNDPDAENSYYTSNGVLFLNYINYQVPMTRLVFYPQKRTYTSYVVPSRVTDFAEGAFRDNMYIQSVTIREGVYNISNFLFSGCINLKNVQLPNNIEYIGVSAFDGCSKLESIKLPYYLKCIYDYAFEGCSNLKTVTAKNPTAPLCEDDAFPDIESQIDLYVPVGSDYAQYDPWKRMKSITETYTLENYGIRVLGTEVNEINYKDVFNNGRVRYNTNGTLYLYKVDVSSTSDNIKYIDNYGVDDLYIDITGTCKISTTGNGSYPFYLQKKTTFIGDTLIVNSPCGISSSAPVVLSNKLYYATASNKLFFVPDLTVNASSDFIGTLGSSAEIGWVGNLTLGEGKELVSMYEDHTLTYDSGTGTILDNDAAITGDYMFMIARPYPIIYSNLRMSSAMNYFVKDLFTVSEDEEGVLLEGYLYGYTSDTILKTLGNVRINLTGDSYLCCYGDDLPALHLTGEVTIGGTGKLTVISQNDAAIKLGASKLTINDLDVEIRGAKAGIKGTIVNIFGINVPVSDVTLNNVAGTIEATEEGMHSMATLLSLTLNDCYIANNAFFNLNTHNVDASELVLSREAPPSQPTAIGVYDNGQWINDKDAAVDDLQGQRVETPQPGQIYIVRDADGSTHKVVAQ
ncbi:MAG: leucine-rich repeat domain-containing protein [Bacteroidales bacterium]|nr:leucine-rich repeat domain-containing protein [Bacteroidales bacterium]